MKKITNLLAILLLVASCTTEPKKTQKPKLEVKDTIAIEQVTMDYLLNNNWEMQQIRKTYYSTTQDSGMLYQLIPDSVGIKYYYTQYTFHIIGTDTFVHYYDGGATWYQSNPHKNYLKLRRNNK